MSSQGSTNNLVVGARRAFPYGTLAEVIKIESAVLVLMDYDEGWTVRIMRRGEFILHSEAHHARTHSHSDHSLHGGWVRWPITRDAPVIRIGDRSFTFALPALMYGLSFSRRCTEEVMDAVERVCLRSSVSMRITEGLYPVPLSATETEPGFCTTWRPRMERITNQILVRFGHVAGRSPSAVGNQASGALRAIRVSATTQLIAKTILSGLLSATHADIHDSRADGVADSNDVDTRGAYPTIATFTDLVEAVELVWVIASVHGHLLTRPDEGLAEPLGFRTWTLNHSGLLFFMHVLSLAGDAGEKQEIGNSSIGEDPNHRGRCRQIMGTVA